MEAMIIVDRWHLSPVLCLICSSFVIRSDHRSIYTPHPFCTGFATKCNAKCRLMKYNAIRETCKESIFEMSWMAFWYIFSFLKTNFVHHVCQIDWNISSGHDQEHNMMHHNEEVQKWRLPKTPQICSDPWQSAGLLLLIFWHFPRKMSSHPTNRWLHANADCKKRRRSWRINITGFRISIMDSFSITQILRQESWSSLSPMKNWL